MDHLSQSVICHRDEKMKTIQTPIYGSDEPQTQTELTAYIWRSARIDRIWIAAEQHYYDAVTVTLFDKRTDREQEDKP